jgi:hypothetical protein
MRRGTVQHTAAKTPTGRSEPNVDGGGRNRGGRKRSGTVGDVLTDTHDACTVYRQAVGAELLPLPQTAYRVSGNVISVTYTLRE